MRLLEWQRMRPFLLFIAALLLVSCTNFSGKLDALGRQDAVMDASAVVSERYRVDGKCYVPVTVRYVEAHEPWLYTNALTKEMTAALRGDPEPQGESCRFFMPEEAYILGEKRNRKLVAEEDFPLARAEKERIAPIEQGSVLAADYKRGNTYYWYTNGENPMRFLHYVKDVPAKRSFGNYVRLPLCYALKPVDGALSFILLGLFHDDDDSEKQESLGPASSTSY